MHVAGIKDVQEGIQIRLLTREEENDRSVHRNFLVPLISLQHYCWSSLPSPSPGAGYPVINDPLYNHDVFGPVKGKGGDIGGKTDEQLVKDLINIHNAENWLGIDGDSDLSLFKPLNPDDGMSLAKGNYSDNQRNDDCKDAAKF